MKIGYIRVSTQEQNTVRQEVLMESLGVDEVYIDRMSGKNTGRPELRRMLEYVRRGDRHRARCCKFAYHYNKQKNTAAFPAIKLAQRPAASKNSCPVRTYRPI